MVPPGPGWEEASHYLLLSLVSDHQLLRFLHWCHHLLHHLCLLTVRCHHLFLLLCLAVLLSHWHPITKCFLRRWHHYFIFGWRCKHTRCYESHFSSFCLRVASHFKQWEFSVGPPQPFLLGRPDTELVHTYLEQKKRFLSNPARQRVYETVYVSLSTGLNLSQYIHARSLYCKNFHSPPCNLSAFPQSRSSEHWTRLYCVLSNAFNIVASMKTYTAEHARSLLLQMPLVSVRIGKPETGYSFSILMEKFPGTDYSKS